MPEWSNEEIVRLWLDLLSELGLKGDERSGAALWTVFSNNERVLDADKMVVDVGTFRHAGGLIASICGGSYLDYYLSSYRADELLVEFVRTALIRRGFTFTNWDEWEAGVRVGRYPCPERLKDYFARFPNNDEAI